MTHPDPEDGQYTVYSGRKPGQSESDPDIIATSINCVRGVAAEAIKAILFGRREEYDKFRPAVNALIRDPHPAVRVAPIGLALPLWNIDRAPARALLRGKRWLLFRAWGNLDRGDRQELRALLALNRRLAKAHLLKEQLTHLWDYIYEGAAWRFLTTWVKALRWQRLPAFDKVAQLLSRHLDGILAAGPRPGSFRARRIGRGGRDEFWELVAQRRAFRAP